MTTQSIKIAEQRGKVCRRRADPDIKVQMQLMNALRRQRRQLAIQEILSTPK